MQKDKFYCCLHSLLSGYNAKKKYNNLPHCAIDAANLILTRGIGTGYFRDYAFGICNKKDFIDFLISVMDYYLNELAIKRRMIH